METPCPWLDHDIFDLLDTLQFEKYNRLNTEVSALNIGVVKRRGKPIVETTSFTMQHANVVRTLVGWVKQEVKIQFAGIYITRNFPSGLEARHRDVHNRGKVQAWRAGGDFSGGELLHWPMDSGGDAHGEDLKYLRDEDACKHDGRTWALVDLSKAHEVMPYERNGNRYGFIVYIPSSIDRATPTAIRALHDLGFPYTHKQAHLTNWLLPSLAPEDDGTDARSSSKFHDHSAKRSRHNDDKEALELPFAATGGDQNVQFVF